MDAWSLRLLGVGEAECREGGADPVRCFHRLRVAGAPGATAPFVYPKCASGDVEYSGAGLIA